ncbi:MAG: hypothetical protein ABI606_23370 [Rhodoferax sp.]
MKFYFQLVLICVFFGLLVAAQETSAQTKTTALSDTDAAVLQRLAQYEYILDSKLSTKVGLCVDEIMGEKWILPDDPAVDIRQSVIDKTRRSAESCAVATNGEPSRLVAAMRRQMEQRLALAIRLDQSHAATQNCVINSSSPDGLKGCLTIALLKTPSEIDLSYWLGVYARRTAQ